MENAVEGMVLKGADIKARENLPSDVIRFTEVVKQRLEKLKADPEVTPIKDHKLREFTENIQNVLEEDLSKIGLKPHKVENVFEVSKEFLAKGDDKTSMSSLGYVDQNTLSVLLWNFNLPDDRTVSRFVGSEEVELSLFKKAIIIGHEIYHASVPSVWRTVTVDDNSVRVESWRTGLTYQAKDGPWALEEGLAQIWEDNRVENLAREMFPDGALVYDKYLKKIKDMGYKDKRPRNIDTATNQIWVIGDYTESKKLVNFLIEKVPRFKELAEYARMENKIGEFAAAVDNVFGVGISNKLLNTKDKGAKETLEELQDLLNLDTKTFKT